MYRISLYSSSEFLFLYVLYINLFIIKEWDLINRNYVASIIIIVSTLKCRATFYKYFLKITKNDSSFYS